MKITQDFATTSDCYRAGRTITIKGLMLHSVGCNQPDPKVFARLWKNSKDANDVCCHGVLGADGTVIQTLPWNRRGVASGHADVEHIWNKYGLTMNQFRKDIKAAMSGSDSENDDNNNSDYNKNPDLPYIVRVSIDDLNIRTGPGTEYPTTGNYTGKGAFTITEKNGNWGKLKSGAGWIYLGYAERI